MTNSNKIRIIFDGARTAEFNMACDESFLIRLSEGLASPTLRFYAWEKPTVSYGYFQDPEKIIDFNRLKEYGFTSVRRPTGGRAVLHWKEVTFCITIPTDGESLQEIFKNIHLGLCEGLKKIGIPAEVVPYRTSPSDFESTPQADGKNRTASCFASPSRFELSINGKKAAGTAQKQLKGFLLAHGSIPIKSTYRELFDVLKFPDEETRNTLYEKARKKMTSIFDETGREFTFNEIAHAAADGIIKSRGLLPEIYPITDEEAEEIWKIGKTAKLKY